MNDRTPHANQDPDAEQLVAYLDGELDDTLRQEIERRLATDADFRLRLQGLQQAWDMLDLLPRTEANSELTKTTVEMVVQQVSRRQRQIRTGGSVKRVWYWASAACLVVLTGLVAYGVTSRLLSIPDQKLVRDLPVIENVDLYRNVGDIEFLHRLDESGLFAGEIEDMENEL